MRKTLTAAVALVAVTAAFALAAVAAGGTHSAKQRVRIDIKGAVFVLKPTSHGRVQPDTGTASFCCWGSRYVIRAGAKLEVTNPRIAIVGKKGTLEIREQIEWVGLPDDWSVQTGTWKVVGGTGPYAGLSGHGRIASVWTRDQDLRVRIFGFLQAK